MPPKTARRRNTKAPDSNITNTPIFMITLGDEEPEIALIAPPDATLVMISSPYLFKPLFSQDAFTLALSNDIL